MARSSDEIQADIALTRRQIEHRLDALQRQVTYGWWLPYALLAGGLVAGALLARVGLFGLLGGGARAIQTGLSAAAAIAAIDHFLAERRADRSRGGALSPPRTHEPLRDTS